MEHASQSIGLTHDHVLQVARDGRIGSLAVFQQQVDVGQEAVHLGPYPVEEALIAFVAVVIASIDVHGVIYR